MLLKDKINNINIPKIEHFTKGSDNTIAEFFENFIKPRLPSPSIIKQWHKILMKYTDPNNLPNISCCVRYGNNGSKVLSSSGESKYYKLRRGWLTKNVNDNFEYFFADNFFSSFIYKMALDGFCPTLEEFSSSFKNHSFPYGFGYLVDKKINEMNGVVIATAADPGFLGKYKLSHIFDSGDCFEINGKVFKGKGSDKELSEIYYPIGHSNDFLKNDSKIRIMDINDVSKKVIVAKFLRLVHPLNYFLTPSKKLHNCEIKVRMNDIGEDERMIAFMRDYLKKIYPIEYKEFVERILWYEDSNAPKSSGSTYIGISYDPNLKKEKNGEQSKEYKNANIPEILFNPSKEDDFKNLLLEKKKAKLIWVYSDGKKVEKIWNAKQITANSSVRTNIQSKSEWRKRKENGLEKVFVEILN